MRSVTVTLADKDYTIVELKARLNEGYRKKVKARLEPLIAMIQNGPNTAISMQNVGQLFGQVQEFLFGSVESIRELVADYSPEIKADIDRITEEAFDSEMIDVFLEVMKLAFPFGHLFSTSASPTGLIRPPTSQS